MHIWHWLIMKKSGKRYKTKVLHITAKLTKHKNPGSGFKKHKCHHEISFLNSGACYQRQYSSSNLAVRNVTDNTASVLLWHESVAKRGSKEIGSYILTVLPQH
ncbi:hypothetical protein PR048_009963 [Dryococelus australis]|uniref:Uncharacterized protein n=1 Tax=Dryococelus australis TaxID=614101 RepID=A0ABQ9I2C5_9NEOP|nr:hypothetical protein PR048_009963 [Dryococelus australis]